MQKLAIKTGLLGLIFLGLFWPLNRFYDHYYQTHLDLCDKARWILSLTDSSYQDAFIGSSRAYNMLDVNSYTAQTGRSAINLATSGSGFGENYLLLQRFLQQGNRLDRLIIQVDIYNLDAEKAYSYSFHEYKYLPWLQEDSVAQVVKDHVPAHKYFLWRYIPFTAYMEFNQHYDFYKTLRGGFACEGGPFLAQSGSLLRKDADYKDFREKAAQAYSFNALDWTYFQRLVAFAQSQGIEVILYQAPEMADYLAHQVNRSALLQHYTDFAVAHQLAYYRFEDLALTRDRQYFRDFTHLNRAGSILFTEFLREKISPLEPPIQD